MKQILMVTVSALAVLHLSDDAFGQARSYQERENLERIKSMEKRIEGLQRTSKGVAGSNVALSELEEELRAVRGKVEENEYRLNKIQREMDLLSKDVDFRLQSLQRAIHPLGSEENAPITSVDTNIQPTEMLPPPAAYEPPNPTFNSIDGIIERETKKKHSIDTPMQQIHQGNEVSSFLSAKDQYNHGFKLMNQGRYTEAGEVFKSFAKTYPEDSLIGNVYYWLGETYYVQEDYLQAADAFRQGFEVMPKGIKAPDNLLKLGMSLGRLDKKEQACVVLDQLQVKFKDRNKAVLERAKRERTIMECK